MALTMDSILKLSTQKKILILIGLLCVIGGLYGYTLFLPIQDEIARLKAEDDKTTREVHESEAITRELATFRAQVKTLTEELNQALAQLPNEKEIPEMLKNVSTLGKESSLEFTLFKPRPEDPRQFYARVPIELTILGTYHNTGVFFDRVSKLPRIINVVDFNMIRAKDVKGRSDGKDEILIKTSCLLNTYRFIEKKAEERKGENKKGARKEAPSKGEEKAKQE
jgi:type IV pilus assembly protein PilO